jgi:hypothetical protein
MNVRLQREHRLRFLAPLPDNVGDKVDPHKGQTFKSFNCCLTLIVEVGTVTTILVVGVGRNFGITVGLAAGFGFNWPVALRFIAFAAAPPHTPHAIMIYPFVHQHAEHVLVDTATLAYLLPVLSQQVCLFAQL